MQQKTEIKRDTPETSGPKGLYGLIGGRDDDIKSKDVFARINPEMSESDQKRLSDWAIELRFWEEYGQVYGNLEKAHPYSNLAKAIEKAVDPKPSELWLDVGCGPLRVSEIICEKAESKVWVDAMDIFLAPARKKLKELEKKGNIFRSVFTSSMTDPLPSLDNSFNGIGANLVLPYVTDFVGLKGKDALSGVLREMFRILKPGGRLVWSTPTDTVNFNWVFLASMPDMLNVYRYVKDRDFSRLMQGVKILKHALAIQKKGKEGTYTFLPKKELAELLAQVGFVNPTWEKTFTQQVWVNRVSKPA